jgi:hypothetical protein
VETKLWGAAGSFWFDSTTFTLHSISFLYGHVLDISPLYFCATTRNPPTHPTPLRPILPLSSSDRCRYTCAI